jgi:hypothetical protein
MPIDTAQEAEKLIENLKKPFQSRDKKWADRRKIVLRQMGRQLQQLPLSKKVGNKALMIQQTEVPNQEAHRRVKRLLSNKARFEVIVHDDDPDIQHEGQLLENGLKALYKWMNRGKLSAERKSTTHQQRDGLGLLKASFIPTHGDTLAAFDEDSLMAEDSDEDSNDVRAARAIFNQEVSRYKEDDENREAKAFHTVTEKQLRTELPPFRLSAPDPLTCYWWEDEDGVEVIAETGKKAINPLLEVFGAYGLRYDVAKGTFYRIAVEPGNMDAVGADTSTPSKSIDSSIEVDFTEIRTRDQVVIYIQHPRITAMKKEQRKRQDDKGVILTFENPFGPYTTGFALVPGDITGDPDPADQYQPPILAAINAAQPYNILSTAQLSASMESALADKYVEVKPDNNALLPANTAEADKTGEVKDGTPIPNVPGEVRRVESPNVEMDKAVQRVQEDDVPYRFQEVLAGDAKSEDSGHKLALQVAQADSQVVPYQNSRAEAIEEIMMGIVYAVRKHGLTVYIPTLPDSVRTGKESRVSEPSFIGPDMADLQFSLIVTLGSETAVTKYAKWQAMAQREEQGTLGYQTLIEESDVENPEDELKRVFEGKLLKATMEATIPMTVDMVVQAVKDKLAAFTAPPEVAGASGLVGPDGQPIASASGLANGGGGPGPPPGARLPGIQMPVTQSTSEFGPSVPEGGGDAQGRS